MPIIAGAVGAFKVLVDGAEIETVSGVTTPDVEIPATEVSGAGIMGTVSIPNFGQVGAMVFAITAPGAGAQRAILMSGGEHSIEVRVAKNVRAVDGSLVAEGTKYFATGYFSKVSGGDIAVGGRPEDKYEYSVYRFREVVDGRETVLIDQLRHIYQTGGVNHMEPFDRLL